jgi:hypothetical protein
MSNELLKLRRNKIYKARSLVVAIAISCLPIASAIAQQTSLVGEWNGTVENWAGNGLRKLIVAPDGSCRWGYPDTPGGPGAEVVLSKPECGNHRPCYQRRLRREPEAERRQPRRESAT